MPQEQGDGALADRIRGSFQAERIAEAKKKRLVFFVLQLLLLSPLACSNIVIEHGDLIAATMVHAALEPAIDSFRIFFQNEGHSSVGY